MPKITRPVMRSGWNPYRSPSFPMIKIRVEMVSMYAKMTSEPIPTETPNDLMMAGFAMFTILISSAPSSDARETDTRDETLAGNGMGVRNT